MPRYGFNFLWMFSLRDSGPEAADLRALDFLAEHGFDFVRIPCDYRFWTHEFRYFEPDEHVFEALDGYLEATRERGLHLSLNLHRAPGYCINGNHLERHNLWLDSEAQDAFVWLWEGFARRYLGVPNDSISFDLLNEPPDIGQYGMTRDIHAALMRRTVAAIRVIDPHREIVLDGLGGGHLAMPELANLGVIHSGRGYQPMPISHWGANWWTGWKEAPAPSWPGQVWDGQTWDADKLWEFYEPWREVAAQGVKVHIGEFGCYNQTPNEVAMAWMRDLLAVYKRAGWGYGLWNFEGDFGIIGHGREGAKIETIDGYAVDREYFELLKEARV